MGTIEPSRAVIQALELSGGGQTVAALDLLRLDLVHPAVSGNKWFKLKHNLRHASQGGYPSVLSFGGAWSNHLVACAAAAQEAGLQSIGMVRGNYASQQRTPTLEACTRYGMRLEFLTREAYGRKTDPAFLEDLSRRYGGPFIIPEGGANSLGRNGAEEIAALVPDTYTHVCVSVGSGTTAEGLRNALPGTQMLLGFVPMKKGAYLTEQMAENLSAGKDVNWRLFDDWHFGGFGRYDGRLLQFMNDFFKVHKVPLDLVYTSKMMYGVFSLLERGFFPDEARVICIHTGGLQGNASVQDRLVFGTSHST